MQQFSGILLSLGVFFIKFSTGQRRITNGTNAVKGDDTSFMVYFVNADGPYHPGWLCAGSLIHPLFILTSAACMSDSDKLYAIAGYRKYIKAPYIGIDICTRHMKRKIISFCTYEEYTINNKSKGDWVDNDMAIARVDIQFNIYDKRYLNFCSYLPTLINLNYNPRYERTGKDVVVYGWGHTHYYRVESDNNDYNVENLRWARTKIAPHQTCETAYKKVYTMLVDTIQRKGICTDGLGELDGNGTMISAALPSLYGCTRRKDTSGYSTEPCPVELSYVKNTSEPINKNSKEKFSKDSRETLNNESRLINKTSETLLNSSEVLNKTGTRRNFQNTRRNGICQNDHGAPLVNWIGGRPYVIGVASAYLVKQNMRCTGPYIFISVTASASFIECVLEENRTRSSLKRRALDNENKGEMAKSPCESLGNNVNISKKNITWKH